MQIWVENPGPGSLSVVVTGPSLHVVDRTSIVYTGDNVYEVSFTVPEQGVYYIQVKWGNKNVTQTPYMCEVTL
ncbi:hypothetical protein DPMN_007019 [Dreissena polymorpha]|uniref:Uncharacterized protein n=1 Tax=Dreissena polymorpha TaxID=45954 RepID=A0A9D4MV41_DREPO|nr:hypothetical protein DPMN_007019 [Dreissena polymorpha]